MNPRLPAEWEIQDAVLMAWPHDSTDWAGSNLPDVHKVYTEIIRQITRFERLLLIVPDSTRAKEYLQNNGIDTERVKFAVVPVNDTWARDFGPVTVMINNYPAILDFGFNGWGLKYPADRDNMVTRQLKSQGFFAPNINSIGFILEGGSIESDGLGTILTTANCLLSPNRNPQLEKAEIEEALGSLLGAKRVLWLENGYLAGDDTDSHIDTLARLCPNNTIVYQTCNNPLDEHYVPLLNMENELKSFRSPDGTPYRLIPLPWPKARFDENAIRLPATYANFLIINGAVLLPVYQDPDNDDLAISVLAGAFPGREIIPLDCLPLLIQRGSLHCLTMQLPEGVLT